MCTEVHGLSEQHYCHEIPSKQRFGMHGRTFAKRSRYLYCSEFMLKRGQREMLLCYRRLNLKHILVLYEEITSI